MEYDDLFEEEELTKVYDRDIFRRLLQYVRPYRFWVLFGAFLILIEEGSWNLTPLIAKYAIDEFLQTDAARDATLWTVFGTLRWLLIGYASLLLIDLVAAYAKAYVTQIMGQHIMRDLRMEVFRHIHRLHAAYFDRTPVGRLLTRVMNDVAALNELFASGIVDSLGSVIGLCVIATMMFVVNWQLALVALCVLPVIGTATFAFQILSRRAYREWRRQLSRLNAFMNERIGGLSTVQLFGQERRTFDRFIGINRLYRRAALRGVFAMAFFGPLVEFAGGLSTAVIVWYGGGQIVQQHMTLGELFAFLTWGQRFFWPLRNLAQQYNTLLIAMASAERIFQILNTEPAVKEREGAVPIPAFEREIEFRDAWFAYDDDDYVIKGINLTIRKGEKIAVVGATGSGKTTLTNLLCRFYDVQKGGVFIDGLDIREARMRDLRELIAIVQQDVFLFAGDVTDNIRLGSAAITEEDVRRAAEQVQADTFIRSLPGGYAAEVKESGSTFSVGQKQLLAFARALAFDPQILILDEATSAVDTETELLIQKGTRRLLEARTSIIIAHRLSTIQDADKIVVMHLGLVCEIGTHTELLRKRGIYYRLHRLQYTGQEALAP